VIPLNFYPSFSSFTTHIPVQGSVRGRLGYAFDRILVYVTGGAEFADVQNTFSSRGIIGAFPGGTDSFSSVRTGWTLGGGVEYAIADNWSLRAEYRYTDFGRYFDYFANTYPGYFLGMHLTDNSVRAGFSCKFDLAPAPLPVVAKY
jgi:outer membrane immunogenic protein